MLGQLCQQLEREYGLEIDNHQARKTAAENRAQDMERHSGIESLIGWIQRECLESMKTAKSWAELHQVLVDNGLEIRERANGLVITNGQTTVKASSVSRDLSKPKLEARLGAFEPAKPDLSNIKPKRRYEALPIRTRIDTSELYARYRAEQDHSRRDGQTQLANARSRKTTAIDAAKRAGWLKRSAIKLMVSGGLGKKALYSLAAKSLKSEIDKIVGQYGAERAVITKRYRREAWADWLRRRATEGDTVALVALRAREGAQALKGRTLTGQGQRTDAPVATDATVDSITKRGTIIYRVETSAIRDDGARLAISLGATPACLEAGLKMAMLRYGSRLTVSGSDAFKEEVAAVAARTRLSVTFADMSLERRRRELVSAQVRAAMAAFRKPLVEPKQNGLITLDIANRPKRKKSFLRGL